MQATSTPPPTPAAPQAPAITVQTTTAPATAQELAALRARRSEISSQLSSAQSRRDRLAQSLRRAEGAADRAGLEQRIVALDKRILQLEADLAEAGSQIAAAPGNVIATTEPPRPPTGMRSSDISMIATVFTIFVLGPLAIALARLLWKRATAPAAPRAAPEIAQRLERLEQAVDTIAIEMERVSEGQRFMTRLLTEGNGFAALAAGQRAADPARVREDELARVPRKGV